MNGVMRSWATQIPNSAADAMSKLFNEPFGHMGGVQQRARRLLGVRDLAQGNPECERKHALAEHFS